MRARIVLLGLPAVLASLPALALEPGKLGGEPVLVDVTESSSVYYNFDNRDTKPSQVSTRPSVFLSSI